jgi:hypothetical protein
MNSYRFSPSLLDKFEGYLNSSRIYQEYWGFSEDPAKSEAEFEQEQFQGLIDMINRVPFESEAADKGTAFNEVVDCIIENRVSENMKIKSYPYTNTIAVGFKEQIFNFPLDICVEFGQYLKGALTQQWTNGEIETSKGKVKLIGCIDQLLPFKICDTKTLGKYSVFKFRNNWQHIVYPFCLHQNGVLISEFEYVITDFKSTWTELYVYDEAKDIPKLKEHCEKFIEFIELNRDKITDKRIFDVLN